MNEKIKYFIKELNSPNLSNPRIKNIINRFLFLPLATIWFLIQLLSFSFLGGIPCVIGGIISLILSIFVKKEEREFNLETGIVFILLPIIATIIWLYRYFKLGEYNVLGD